MSTLIRDRAADAEMEADLPEPPCLFLAAGKTVHHAAQPPVELLQFQDELFESAARMQDKRQVEFARELQLRTQEPELAVAIQGVVAIIQSAFAERAGLVRRQPRPQRIQVGLTVLL